MHLAACDPATCVSHRDVRRSFGGVGEFMFQAHIAHSVNSPVAGFQEVVNVNSSFGVLPDAGGVQT